MSAHTINSEKKAEEMTLAEHAEAWAKENGETVPPKDTDAWKAMYQRWVEFAFADFGE